MESYDKLLNDGIKAAEVGSYAEALIVLNQAAEQIPSPIAKSYTAYCQANSDGRLSEAAIVCQESIAKERHNSVHYLILGRIFLLAGNRTKAIRTFRTGLKIDTNPLIIKELRQLGLRKEPIIEALDRGHPLNQFLGKTFAKMGLK